MAENRNLSNRDFLESLIDDEVEKIEDENAEETFR